MNNGELFFNKTENLNEGISINDEQRDENEGALWIKNIGLEEVRFKHPTKGEFKFKTDPNDLAKLIQFNHNYLTCSFYIITTKDFEKSNILKIDERMLKFGSHALIIKNPKILLDNIKKVLKEKDIGFNARKVEYRNLKEEGEIKMNPFIKKIEHNHQKEYRIILKNYNEPLILKIDKIDSNGILVTSQYLVESKWEAVRK
jgi:hypothetical protein